MNKINFKKLLLVALEIAAFCVACVYISDFLDYVSERTNFPVNWIVLITLFGYATYWFYEYLNKEDEV